MVRRRSEMDPKTYCHPIEGLSRPATVDLVLVLEDEGVARVSASTAAWCTLTFLAYIFSESSLFQLDRFL